MTEKQKPDLFEATKIKMVMKIYGISRMKAMKKIAERKSPELSIDNVNTAKPSDRTFKGKVEIMPAEDFFRD